MESIPKSHENYIPFEKNEVVLMCCEDGFLDEQQQKNFREFCRILESYYHFEYFQLSEKLKRAYSPFNPDNDAVSKKRHSKEGLKILEKELLATLTKVLKKANFEGVSQEELEIAMNKESLFKINLAIDFEDFEQFLIFKRGEHQETVEVKKFIFWTEEVEIIDLERVVIYIQFKDKEYFKLKGKNPKNLMFEPSSTILKLFKNIPKADVEMLFPNAHPQMSRLDKLMIGIPGVGAGLVTLLKVLPALGILFGLILSALGIRELKGERLLKVASKPEYVQTLTNSKIPQFESNEEELFLKKLKEIIKVEELAENIIEEITLNKREGKEQWAFNVYEKKFVVEKTANEIIVFLDELDFKSLMQVVIGLVLLAGFGFKQYMNYKNKKLKFAKLLSDNLYFKNLDNNAGVFHHLIDAAEEEECKEAILAFYFLLISDQPLTEKQLDEKIEHWFSEKHKVKLDFEVDDAVGKLAKLGISHHENNLWTGLNLEQAKEKIDHTWDNIFSYNGKESLP